MKGFKSVVLIEPNQSDEETANKFIDWLRNNRKDDLNETLRQENNQEKKDGDLLVTVKTYQSEPKQPFYVVWLP